MTFLPNEAKQVLIDSCVGHEVYVSIPGGRGSWNQGIRGTLSSAPLNDRVPIHSRLYYIMGRSGEVRHQFHLADVAVVYIDWEQQNEQMVLEITLRIPEPASTAALR